MRGLQGVGSASPLSFGGRAGLLAAVAMAMAAAMLASAGGNPSGSAVYSIPGLGSVVASLVGIGEPSPPPPQPSAEPSAAPPSAPQLTPAVSSVSQGRVPQAPARPWYWIILSLLPLALVASGLVILLPLVLPRLGTLGWLRRSRWAVAAEVERAVATTLEELEATQTDPRLAVIAAYSKMEKALAGYVQPRLPSETPFEFMSRALVPLQVSRTPIQRLTELFELASYSQHRIDDAMRTDALGAVTSIQAELQLAQAAG